MVTLVKTPIALSTAQVPPWALANNMAVERPSPAPLVASVKEIVSSVPVPVVFCALLATTACLVSSLKASKSYGILSSEIPDPES